MDSPAVLAFNPNWVQITNFVFAAAVAGLAVAIKKHRGTARWDSPTAIFMDLLRGAGIFPLLLVMLSAIAPSLGKLAIDNEPVLVSLAAAYALFAFVEDFRKNL